MWPRKAISLFSNCGAGDLGYREAGFRFQIVSDIDERRLEIALLNHPEAKAVPGDLTITWPTVIEKYREQAEGERLGLLAACPPCQGMSSVNSDRGVAEDADAGSRDERNLLVEVIANVAVALQPHLVVVENIPAFLTRKVRHPESNEPVSAAALLISRLQTDYIVYPFLSNLADYGVPQNRHRTFLTFISRTLATLSALRRLNLTPYPKPTHDPSNGGAYVSLREALDSFELPSLDAKSEQAATPEEGPDLHFVPVWPNRQYQMVAAIPPDSGKSAWDSSSCPNCGKVEVGLDDATCPKCQGPLLRPVVKTKDGDYRLVKGFRTSSYRRMRPDEPAPTITTASGHVGSSFTIHPSENRLLSPLECALLQTIPRNFQWGDALDKWGHTNIRAMIGEAVPPRFTKLHGQVLRGLLVGKLVENSLGLEDMRCAKAIERLCLDLIPGQDYEVESFSLRESIRKNHN